VLDESATVVAKTYDNEMPMMVFDGQFDARGLALLKASFVEMGILDRQPADDAILTRRFLPVAP
jgi:hypothetical protein